MEILRRVLLAGGLCASIVLALYVPPLLLDVHAVDFTQEYNHWESAPWPENVVRKLIEKPATLDDYIAQNTGGRVVEVHGDSWTSFVAQLQQVAARQGRAFFAPDEPPLDALIPAFQRSRAAGWLNTHVAVQTARGTEYFEVILVTDARDSHAPADMVHPLRAGSWWWALAGLLAYALLFWPRQRPDIVAYDPLGSTIPLDAIGCLWLALSVAIPLWFTDSFSEALGEERGFTAFFWVAAALALPTFLVAARRAASTIQVTDEGFVVSSLSGVRKVFLADVLAVESLETQGASTGVVLKMRDGRDIPFDWTDRLRFRLILDAFARAGLYAPQRGT
jgi:hypothetical protein